MKFERFNMEDTISAVATAWGEGGIGIVRISGPEAKDVLERIFMPIKKNRKKGEGLLPDSVGETIGSPIENRRMTYGKIIDPKDGTVVDEVLAVYMKAPYTYTMEDVVEINCHGSIVSLRKTLALTLEHGARIAEPGEFTKRAFLNGRIDLSQAEAVIDLIRAKTDRGFDVAMDQMEGSLSREIKAIRAKLMDVLVNITVNLDYPDEDIEEITYDKLDRDLRDIDNDIDRLLNTAKTGRLLREGLAVAIIGKPNVGKSSLMNRFLRESRAIVTDIPGTTRDVIEESMSLRGIPVKLIDTAGIRETDDIIEKIGIEKSMDAFNRADLVIFVLDGSRELSEEDKEIAEHIEGKKTLVLVNKADLTQVVTEEEIKALNPDSHVIFTSMENGEGLDLVEEHIYNMVYGGQVKQENGLIVTNVRHSDLMKKAKEEIEAALFMCGGGEALDFLEVNVRQCFEYLGEIIGEAISDTIIDEVFARFCLGK